MDSVVTTISCICAGGSMGFLWGNPFGFKQITENEMRLRDRNPGDPEQGPRKEKGDIYILIGAVTGIITGGTLGVIIGGKITGIGGIALGLIFGIIIGGLIGTSIGNYVKIRKKNTL